MIPIHIIIYILTKLYNDFRNIVKLNIFVGGFFEIRIKIFKEVPTIYFRVFIKRGIFELQCSFFNVINVSKNFFMILFLIFSLACAAGKLLLDIVRENGKYTYPKVTQ